MVDMQIGLITLAYVIAAVLTAALRLGSAYHDLVVRADVVRVTR